jgi:hypothetical protein
VTITVLSSDRINSLPPGTTFSEVWSFRPDCEVGACGGTLNRKGEDLNAGKGALTSLGGGRYSGKDFRLLDCVQQPSGNTIPKVGKDRISFTFHVVAGKVIGGVWQATKIAGTMNADVTPTAEGRAQGCPDAFAKEKVEGVRVAG